jgi:hypothetical protein
MGSMDSLQIFQPLGPDDLRMAASAFDAALRSLDESSSAIDAYSARQALAKFIMESTLRGERDPAHLTKAALEHLRAPRGLLAGLPGA